MGEPELNEGTGMPVLSEYSVLALFCRPDLDATGADLGRAPIGRPDEADEPRALTKMHCAA